MRRSAFLKSSLPIVAIILLSSFLYTLSLSGPSWSPTTAYTNSTLNCTWANSSDTTAQNITVLRNNVVFNTTYENASLTALSNSTLVAAENTTKGEVWTCRVTLYNGSANTTSEANITISNSPPSTEGDDAGIFWNSVDIGYLFTVLEDSVYGIDVNATDADGDTLRYLAGEEFCTRLDQNAGTYSCAPTQAYIINNSPTIVNVTFTATDQQNPAGRTVQFNITPVNDAPVAVLSNQSVPVNGTLNYTFSLTDEENSFPLQPQLIAPAEIQDKLTLTALNSNGTSARLTYNGSTPDYNDVGVWTVTINVTDNSSTLGTNDSRSALYNMSLNITAVGRPPYFTSTTANVTPVGGIYNLLQGQAIQINISANDPDANSTITFLDNTTKFSIVTVKADTNTSDARGQINYTAANGDVGLFNVTITARDQEALTNTTILQFNVTNVNDAPVIYEISNSTANTQSNMNASNLSAYANTLFVYDVNGTDPDLPYGDVLNYSDNTSLFAINVSTGRISFTPADSDIGGPYAINITLTDGSLSTSRTILLTILPNNPPVFNPALPQLNCTTKAQCTLDLANYTEDPEEPGDSIVSHIITPVTGNLSTLTYSNTTGLINFTTAKTDVGNYTLNVTIEDTHGASNWSLLSISINNTPEAPNLTRYDFSGMTIVETHPLSYELLATDDDIYVPSAAENVTFTTNLTLNHSIILLPTSNNTARAMLTIDPVIGDAGTYTINITARDRLNFTSNRTITFQVYAKVPPPNVTNITPWGANATFDIQTSWAQASQPQFADRIADVNMTENTTVVFNVSVNDTRPLAYSWKVNGSQVSAAQAYTRAFDFFSAGRYNVTVNVSNDRLEHTTFTWIVTVRNVNRPPELIQALESPVEVNRTRVFNRYFTTHNNERYFYDPDDDRDSNLLLDLDENNTMRFTTNSTCAVATVSTSNDSLEIVGLEIGSCTVQFFATDANGAMLGGNLITVNVTEIINETRESPQSGGGGGGAGTTFIPMTKKMDKPRAFNLIAPKLVTIYDNKSMHIPVVINNTWNGSLKMVRLSAEVNATGVNSSLDIDFFEEIPRNESREVLLTVTNYRLGGNYEVKIVGNVSDPDYSDQALVLLNSIEQTSDGEDFKVKVTFANDLVNEHPECQELNEVLTKAQDEFSKGNLAQGTQLVESVISGCKYLVSMQETVQEKPARINPIINIDDLSVKAIMIGLLAFVIISSVAFLVYYHYSHKPEDDI